MAVVRTQYAVESNAVAVTNGNPAVLTMTRPASPAEGNTIDFVARPSFRKEFEQGKAFVQLNTASAVAGVSLRKVEILDALGNVLRTILSVADDAFLGNAAITGDLLKSIILKEDEASIRLTLQDISAGAITAQAVARFDFGLNAANFSSSPALL